MPSRDSSFSHCIPSCRWLYGDFGCQYYAFMGFLMGVANLTTLLMIALDRYLVTCRQDLRECLPRGARLPRVYSLDVSPSTSLPFPR